ncbi:MaoC family dehydratase [Deinococcus arenae]|uniref:MaoC family dehydratase n=1 Tax=Deinococcus arenae TaxID=1452751 RepID=A0A8H9GNG1_9DEIO|nr:MaoC family dehydratase [Deinococcus arenae]AWT37650.1 enoyl-CoA hydratase [Deinococcus actinosclerus]GGM37599.1 MaoC family dehydratase [Deinococcus arenae]
MNPQDLQTHLGQQVALSEWVEVTQARIQAFADATGDQQFIHVDPERAAQGPFGGTIAHGFLTLSLLAGEFMTRGGSPEIEGARMVVNYGLNRVRFIAPVRAGARLRNRAVLQAAEPGTGFVQITVLNTIEIDGSDKPACTAESVFRVYL